MSGFTPPDEDLKLPDPLTDHGIPVGIEALDLTVRTYNCLRREGVLTLASLASHSEEDLLNIRNFGQKCVDEVNVKLAQRGLCLSPTRLSPATVSVVHEVVNIYRAGRVTLTVDPDGGAALSTVRFSPADLRCLHAVVEAWRADDRAEFPWAESGSSDA